MSLVGLVMKKAVLQALLPSQITKILEERFTESPFSSIADWNINRLVRIKELVDAISESDG